MKASEIVDKLKSVLLSAEEPQVEPAEEQVELAAEEVEVNEPVELGQEEMAEGDMEEKEEVEVEVEYVSKSDFESAISEIKAMYDALAEKLISEEMEEQVEVPTEELAKEELSSQEPGAEPIAHAPEVEPTVKRQAFAGAKPRNTMANVYDRMFNK